MTAQWKFTASLCIGACLGCAATPAAASEVMRVVPESIPFFIPPKVRGDGEFRGHGPRTIVRVTIEIRSQNELWASAYMKAEETTRDWSTAEGRTTQLIYRHPTVIEAVESSTQSSFEYVDRNHADDLSSRSTTDLVALYRCVGDTSGGECGTETGVEIAFNPVTIRAQKSTVADMHGPRVGRMRTHDGAGPLELLWMGVIDNGEGDRFPRGPKGNFHFTVRSFANGREISHPAFNNFVVRGPYQNEWLDGLEMSYSPTVIIHQWSDPNEVAFVHIWESDDGPGGNDTVFKMLIPRQLTAGRRPAFYGDQARPAFGDALKNFGK